MQMMYFQVGVAVLVFERCRFVAALTNAICVS
jgi:hypothetical protein